MERSPLSSGQLARAVGVGVETLRFYERRGLLPIPKRTASGHRRYPDETVGVLRLIRRAQELGFTLAEIAEMLSLRQKPAATCANVCEMVNAKLDHVERQITKLRAQRSRLKRLRRACPRVRPLRECPVFVSLNEVPAGRERRPA